MGMAKQCFVCGREHDGESVVCDAIDQHHELVRLVASIDGVLTGLPLSVIEYNVKSKGVNDLLHGERFYLSDGRSYLQFTLDELCVVTDFDFIKERLNDIKSSLIAGASTLLGIMVYGNGWRGYDRWKRNTT